MAMFAAATVADAAPARIDVNPGDSLVAVRDKVRMLPAAKKADGVEVVLADGEYVLSIDFVSPEDRGFNLSVDGASTRHVDVKGTNGAISTVKVPVKLTAGVHSIRLSNSAAWMPDIDRMSL